MWRNPISGSTDSVASGSRTKVSIHLLKLLFYLLETLKQLIQFCQSTEQLSGRVSANEYRIPEDLQKELDRRRIGESINQIANSIRRHNSDHTLSATKNRTLNNASVKKMSPNSAEHRASRRIE